MADDNDQKPESIHLSEMDRQRIQRMNEGMKYDRELEEGKRTSTVSMRSMESVRQHLEVAHGFNHMSVQFYDETEHDPIPKLRSKKRDWTQTVPALDHEDLTNWHEHEHTDSEFADDYPHTTLGEVGPDGKASPVAHFHH